MPELTPVAQNINPPDMGKGLSNLSSILGIRQQQQALQTGQYAQQQQQAEATQAQQKSAELQAAQKLAMRGAQSGQYTKPDGSFDRLKMADDIAKVAPTYGQGVSNQLLQGANEIVTNKTALQSLNEHQAAQFAGILSGISQKPDISRADIIDTLNTAADINPSPEFRRMLFSVSAHMPPNATPEELQKGIQSLQSELSGQAQQTPGSMDTLTGTQPGTTNRFSGAFTAAGKPVKKDVAGYAAAGARATGVAGTDIERSAQVSSIANQAPAAIQLSQSIDDLADQINSGKVSKAISSAAAALGVDSVSYARQLLNKDLGQLKTLASSNASTDAKMGTILSGYPDDTSATPTIHTAMDYIRGSFRQNLARGQNLNSYRTKRSDLTGFQHADDVLTQSTNPLMHEYLALKTPAERTGFYQRNFKNAQDAAAFKAKVAGVAHATGQ